LPIVNGLGSFEDDIRKNVQSIIGIFKEDKTLHVDAIIENSGLDAQTVLRLLLEMELHGIVAQHPGKRFSMARPV
jgi:predicted Rossmann fold nucleotide-binding protein DprA/Smf involved in DNA uptake